MSSTLLALSSDPMRFRRVSAVGEAALPIDGETEVGDGGRYRLWELEPGLLCSILGTCLDLEDLRRIARKVRLLLQPELRDYDIHGYFVTNCTARCPLSKLTHKSLDRKYATHVTRFRSLRDPQALWAVWQQALADGDVAGGYWAFMTHPNVVRRNFSPERTTKCTCCRTWRAAAAATACGVCGNLKPPVRI